MMANFERVVDLLSKMQLSEHIKYVQSEISRLEEDPLFISLLTMAIKQPNTTPSVKLSASIMLNRTISRYQSEFDDSKLTSNIMDVVLDMKVEFKYKSALQNCIVAVFELSEQEMIEDVFRTIHDALGIESTEMQEEEMHGEALKLHEFKKLEVLFFLYKCCLESANHMGTLAYFINNYLKETLSRVSITSEVDNIKLLAYMAEFFAPFLKQLIQNSDYDCQDLSELYCENQILIKWIFDILMLSGVTSPPCWISIRTEDNHQLLSNLKTKAAEIHYQLLEFNEKAALGGLFIAEKHYECTGAMINTLTVYAAYPAHLTLYEGFVTVLIKNMNILARLNKEQFKTAYSNLLHSIIFPLLAASQEEIDLFDNDPHEFIRIAEDCCDHQKYGTLKSEVAVLLEILCDQNQQAGEYIIQHCIVSLKVRLALDQNFSAQAPHFLSIETALLLLSVQSYRLSKYPRELEELKSIVNFSKVEGRLSDLQLTRLFTFLAYNYSEIYPNPLQGERWIAYALLSDKHPTVQASGIDFISNVVEDYFSFDFLLSFAQKTLLKGSIYLTALLKIINHHATKIAEKDFVVVLDILQRIVAREIVMYEQREKSHTMDIVSCIHSLRKILDKDTYTFDKPNLKMKIWEFVNFLPNLQKLDLDDEIVRLINCYNSKEVELHQHVAATLQQVTSIFNNGREESTPFYLYYNAIAMKGNFEIAMAVSNVLVQTFTKLYNQVVKDSKSCKAKINIGTILLILQNIVAIYGLNMAEQVIAKLKQLALILIPEDDNPEDKIEYIVVARALNLLLLCCMHGQDQTALKKLLTFQDSPIFQSYDLRVLCACLGKEIFRETDITAVTEMLNIMVKANNYSKEEGIPVKAKRNPTSIKPSSTRIVIRRIQDYEQILKLMKTPFPQSFLPELEIKKVIETMRRNNPYLYQSIVKTLNTAVYEHLKQLMAEVVVQGNKRKIVHVGQPKANGTLINPNVVRSARKRNLVHSENEQSQEEIESKKRNLQKKKQKNEQVRPKPTPTQMD